MGLPLVTWRVTSKGIRKVKGKTHNKNTIGLNVSFTEKSRFFASTHIPNNKISFSVFI